MTVLRWLAVWLATLGLSSGWLAAQTEAQRARETAALERALPSDKDAPYLPSPARVVEKMLDLAEVGAADLVYDLGSGDGRIVIAAAKRGARGVGVEIDPERILEARRNARAAGVQGRVRFLQQDLFDTDLGEATVVTLYLLPGTNMRLRPKLLAELAPGARVVSHSFHMGDWAPARTARIGGARLYMWIVPER